MLRAHARAADLGTVYPAPLDVILEAGTVFQPDVLFVSHARKHVLRAANIVGTPDLCVEILSPSTASLDRARKRDLYARHGVLHYWIVDLDARAIEEYVLDGAAFTLLGRTCDNETFRPAAFPGLELNLRGADLP